MAEVIRCRLLPCVLRYGEALYALLYLFAAAGVLGLVSILVGMLSNSRAASPDEMQGQFHLNRARCVLIVAMISLFQAVLAPNLCGRFFISSEWRTVRKSGLGSPGYPRLHRAR